MTKGKVVITDYGFKNIDNEMRVLQTAGYEVVTAQCKTEQEVIQAAAGANALLVQWAPVSPEVINSLDQCKIIVRYGIGVDNINLPAAAQKNIPVCNVPQYCIDEVADHTLALALSLCRQLTATRQQMETQWKITPPYPMEALRYRMFVTAGFGRIAREVMARARGFKFKLAAYDPYVSAEQMEQLGVTKLTLEEALTQADVLSLHLPLMEDTKHLINENTLRRMKRNAIVVNTSRGGLIDNYALATALEQGLIAGAGLDVFEAEPLPAEHPLRNSPNAALTSHTAWYSEASVPALQQLAAEEVLRGLKGQDLLNRVN
ncbi:D-3-phosphoglycerate dehydrogenase [Filimonas zeae]|uniref:D-isomer specific 2-hydroxyacid dehydrogenase family protein n=1 Tax=Filimonas zeae TaxID=1737353 RepID=A0A917IW62_9BACT|nr:C-terminal binding protein [Filimonas zeae]MDR6338998.1 D-3-phosphoglycerate dehydrogenase [Filimonas zeae]GGH65597.1 D-isomer specific 2-hydroxyacid dehydrogenase family protein [Filimonas zeae]